LQGAHAIGLNRTEITLRSGRSPAKPSLPAPIGFEAAGVIDEVGQGVEGWHPGDPVALVPAYAAAQYALYGSVAIAPARSLVPVLGSMTFEQAAATWVAFGTARAGLISVGDLYTGQTVLISAASSSVGVAAIQTAIRIGRSLSPAPPANRTNYALAGPLQSLLPRKLTLLTTLRSSSRLRRSRRAWLRETGRGNRYGRHAGSVRSFESGTHSCASVPNLRSGPRFVFPNVTRNDQRLAAMKQFVNDGISSGSLVPAIARTFAFDEIVQAHRFLESGNQVGKIVVTI
jgi:NADPH:quinone reductase-like Zn-dependent oxidoreductase